MDRKCPTGGLAFLESEHGWPDSLVAVTTGGWQAGRRHDRLLPSAKPALLCATQPAMAALAASSPYCGTDGKTSTACCGLIPLAMRPAGVPARQGVGVVHQLGLGPCECIIQQAQ